MRQKKIVENTLRSLFASWAIAAGTLALVMGISFFIDKILLPVLLLVAAYFLSAIMRIRNGKIRMCPRIIWAARSSLILAAFAMFVLLLMHNEHLFGNRFNAPYFNPRYPYITCLIITPAAVIISIFGMIMGRQLGICKACNKNYGQIEEEGGLATTIFNNEASHQMRLLFWISLVMGAAQYAYYFLFFINVNFNSPDLFFFNIVPVAVFVLSLIYLASRYYNITEAYATSAGGNNRVHHASQLRFLVTSGDNILLREQGDETWDTPFKAEVNAANITAELARTRFDALGGTAGTALRFLYDSVARDGQHTFHYAAFVPEEDKQQMLRGGRWTTIYEVETFLNHGQLTPALTNEIVRIHTITMAWKTYDREGRRLYPIKHYKPIFRIKDFKDWDVDYNDPVWIQVAMENEDTRFFRARRLWRRCLDIFNK